MKQAIVSHTNTAQNSYSHTSYSRKQHRHYFNNSMTMTTNMIVFALLHLTLQFANAYGHSHDGHLYSDSNQVTAASSGFTAGSVSASEKEKDNATKFLQYFNLKQRHLHGIQFQDEQIYDTNDIKNYYSHENNSNVNKNNKSIPITQSNSIHTKLLDSEIFEPTPPDTFVTLCTNFLLSDAILSDDEINNDEAALFFEYLCNELPVPTCQNKAIPFYSLNIEIQMAFVNAICPRDSETNATIDKECINRLRQVVEDKNQFAYEIDPNRDVNADITRYCSSIYSFSTEFHNGTYQPSPVPSVAPSVSPSVYPSSGPTVTPSLVYSLEPSSNPTPSEFSKTSSPSSSPSPTFSSTLPPSAVSVYQTSFTYMMGFDNELVHDDVLDNERPDIMDATSDAIISTLTTTFRSIDDRRALLRGGAREKEKQLDKRQLPTYLRHLQTLGFSNDQNNGVEHVFSQNASCTSAFTESTLCIIMVSQVTLESTSNITKDDVNNAVYTSIRTSMNDDTFRNEINFIEVKEVKYINDGSFVPVAPREPTGATGVGGGSIAGITIGSVMFLLILAFFVGRARARSEEESVPDDSLSDSENYQDDEEHQQQQRSLVIGNFDDAEEVKFSNANLKRDDAVAPKSRNLPVIEEGQGGNIDNDETLKECGIQLDATSGQVIGSSSAGMSYVSSVYSASSGYSADNPESPTRAIRKGDELVDQLDAAVQAGDWAAVAAIAGDLSQADDISTMSSFHSRAGDISYDPSERDNLSEIDAKRAKEIDKLITEGDWNAVGATAAAFQADADSIGSKEKNRQEKSSTPPQDNSKRKSILDFISGPWNSFAAAKAIDTPEEPTEFPASVSNSDIIEDTDESKDEIINAPMEDVDTKDVLSSSEPSDLSTGEVKSDTQPNGSRDVSAFGAVGKASVAAGKGTVAAASAYHSESEATTTDDDTRQLLATDQKKKRSWTRFTLRRKNNDSKRQKEDTVAATPLSLQEDSSVSSWSHDDSSPDTSMNIYGAINKSKGGIDDMPPEMRAFGEDHGLAAAEKEMEDEARRRERFEDSEGELTNKSSESLRDELDRAIETGDWAAVEKQTNEMLVTGDKPSSFNNISDVDSDMETTDGPEGWSQNHSDEDTEVIDDERIEILEKLIEADDWQGIVNNSQIHTKVDDSIVHDDDDN